jgi:hypothetical protein
MSFLQSHVFLMFVYAVATGLFFTFLWKDEKKERIRFFLVVFFSLFLGGVVLSWLMYPLPIR